MRILHVAYVYPPLSKVADGITNVVYTVTQELAQRGHEVFVYTSDMMDLHGNYSLKPCSKIIHGVRVYYLKSFLRFKTLIVTPSIIHLLSRDLGNFNIVHVHDCRSFQGICVYFFAKIKKVPYVFQPHGSYLFSLPDSIPKQITKITLDKVISNKVFNGASKIIALTEDEAEECRKAGIPNAKITIMPNGIDLSEYDNLPSKDYFKKRFNINKEDKIVLFLGRMHKIKGVDILVKSFARIVYKMKNVKLVIAGPDDGYLDEVKTLVKTLGIEKHVLFTGPLYGKDKLAAYVDAEVYVLPSIYETFPMTVLEAMACNTPIILSTRCGIAKELDGKVALVVNPDVESLSDAIDRLIKNQDLREKFKYNCYDLVKTYSIHRIAANLEALYNQTIKENVS